MAVDLSKLVSREKIKIQSLSGKTIAIDAYNTIYQFLSIIRQPDGTPLMDKEGRVTSHISGIFFRSIEFISNGIKPIFVFDGIPSLLKQRTINARMKRREEQFSKWKKAVEAGDLEEARRHAQASTRINKEIVKSSKTLLELMGIPYINALGEGEAEASYLCSKGIVDAAASQDYDTLLFGSPVVVRNLTISGKRKLPRKNIYISVEPEIINLQKTLESLNISHDQLIWIGIMLGTDFNKGIKGIGPKTALKIARRSSSIDDVISYIKEKYNVEFDTDVHEVEKLFKNPEVEEISKEALEKGNIVKKRELLHFMCDEHGFKIERIEKFVDKLVKSKTQGNQTNINKWFR